MSSDLVPNSEQSLEEKNAIDVVPLTEEVAPFPVKVEKEKEVGKEEKVGETEMAGKAGLVNAPAVQVAANPPRITHDVIDLSDDSDDEYLPVVKRRRVVSPRAPALPSQDDLSDPDDVVFIDHERPAPPSSSDDHLEDPDDVVFIDHKYSRNN